MSVDCKLTLIFLTSDVMQLQQVAPMENAVIEGEALVMRPDTIPPRAGGGDPNRL